MAIGKSSLKKSLAQATISSASALFASRSTDLLLMGIGAYVSAIRGQGWSPSLEQEAKCAASCVSPGREFVIIDAGANVGNWLKAIHPLVSSNGKYFAFEPQPAAAAKVRALGIDQCEVLEMALGAAPGKHTFFASHQADATGSLHERRDTFTGAREYSSFEVQVARLDDFVKQREIKRIDFMKMDLEGGEFDALKGAAECMQSGILRAFSFEFGTSNINSRVFFRDIFDLLVANSYVLSRISPAGRLIPVESYSEEHEYFARTTTYLAKKKVAA